MQKYAYVRLSKREQMQEGQTIEQQIYQLERLGFDRLYQDIQSGDDRNRPGYQALLEQVRQDRAVGKEVEIRVARFDRIGRDDIELYTLIEELDALGVKLFAVDRGYYTHETAAGWMQARQDAFLAQWYLRQLSENIKRGKAYKRDKNRPLGGIAPFGYRWNADKTAYEIDPVTGPIARSWFDAYLSGGSLNSIVKLATSQGYPRSRSGIGVILRNPIYQGHLAYIKGGYTNRDRKRGINQRQKPKDLRYNTHPAIITAAEAKEIERRLSENRRYWGASSKSMRYSVSGLAVCAKCGYKMALSSILNSNKIRYHYFRCRRAYMDRCDNHLGTRMDFVEAAIQNEIAERAETISKFVAQPDRNSDPRLLQLEQEIEQLKPMSHRPAIAAEIEQMQAEIQQIQASSEVRSLDEAERLELLDEVGALTSEEWDLLSIERRKQIYSELIESVTALGPEIFEVKLKI